jgi:hypothetical protein
LWIKFKFKNDNQKYYPAKCLICNHIDFKGNIRKHIRTHNIEFLCKKRVNVCSCSSSQTDPKLDSFILDRFQSSIQNQNQLQSLNLFKTETGLITNEDSYPNAKLNSLILDNNFNCSECNIKFKNIHSLNQHKISKLHLKNYRDNQIKFKVGNENITNRDYDNIINKKGWLSDLVSLPIFLKFEKFLKFKPI